MKTAGNTVNEIVPRMTQRLESGELPLQGSPQGGLAVAVTSTYL